MAAAPAAAAAAGAGVSDAVDYIVLRTAVGESKVTSADLPDNFCNPKDQQLININDACKDNPELKPEAYKIFTELGLFGDGLRVRGVDKAYSFSGDHNKKIVNEMFSMAGNSYRPQTRLQSWHEAKQPGTKKKIGLAAFRDQVAKAYYDAGTSTQRCVTGIGGVPVDVVYTFGTYVDPSGVQNIDNCRPECTGSVWQGVNQTLVLTPAFMNCFGFPGVRITAKHVRGKYEDPPVWHYTISVSPIKLESGPTVHATISYPPASMDGSDPNMGDKGCFNGNANNQTFARNLIKNEITKASLEDKTRLIQSILGKCLGDFTQVAAGFAQTLIDKLYGLTAMLTGDYCVFLRCLQLQQKALLTGSASSIAAFDADMKAAKVAFEAAAVSSVNQKLRTLYNYSPSANPVVRARLELEAAKASAIVENRIQIQAVIDMSTTRARFPVLSDSALEIPPGFFQSIQRDIEAIQDELVVYQTEAVENEEKALTKARNRLLEDFKIIPILSADPGGFDMTLVGGARYTFGDRFPKTNLAAYMLSVLNSIRTIKGEPGDNAQYDYAVSQGIDTINKAYRLEEIEKSLLNANIVDLGRLAAKMSEYANGSHRRRITMFPMDYTVPLRLGGGAKLQTGGGIPEETFVLTSIQAQIYATSGNIDVIGPFNNYRTGIDNNIDNYNLALKGDYITTYAFPKMNTEELVYCQTQAADAELLGMIPPGGANGAPGDALLVEYLNTAFLDSLFDTTVGDTRSKYMFYYAITERGQIAGVQTINANDEYLREFNLQNGIYEPLELVGLFQDIDAAVTAKLKEEELGKQLEERSGTGPGMGDIPPNIVEKAAREQIVHPELEDRPELTNTNAALKNLFEKTRELEDAWAGAGVVDPGSRGFKRKGKEYYPEVPDQEDPFSEEYTETMGDYLVAPSPEKRLKSGENTLAEILVPSTLLSRGGKRRTMKNKSKSKRNAKNQTHRKRKGKAVGKRTATAHRPKTARNAKKITKKNKSNTKTQRSAKPAKKRAINRRARDARKDRK